MTEACEGEGTTASNDEVPLVEEEPIKPKVSWADDPHYLGCAVTFSTQDDCSASTAAADLPLSPKFSEEGSSTAAVMDEAGEILPDYCAMGTPRQEGVRHKTKTDKFDSELRSTCASGNVEVPTSLTLPPLGMGTKVNDVGDPTVSVAILQEGCGEEELGDVVNDCDQEDVNDEVNAEANEESIAQQVPIAPYVGENSDILIDQILMVRSMSTESDDYHLNPSLSDDAISGIILPPSMSGSPASTPASISSGTGFTITSIHAHPSNSATQLMSLPIDSLHCVASFLTPSEWAQYGQTCIQARKTCREIFRRVRMHGFRCATEVISTWKLDHHADARELAALYMSSGVPIYPFSMGHSYQTVCWRMGIEAKSMQEKAQAAAGNDRPPDHSTEGEEDNIYAVDRYFTDRHNGTRDGSHIMCSYLEDKACYMLGTTPGLPTSPLSAVRWNSMAALPAIQRERLLPGLGAADLLGPPGAGRVPDRRARGNMSPLSSATSSPARSMSQSDVGNKSREPKVVLQIHRHLLDQHLLGRSCVDDDGGNMKTPAVSLSADFFHPHLCVHSISTHSRPLTLQNQSPAVSAAPVAASPTSSTPSENLLRDPAFQAWAARAAATVHNRLGGAALDDAEELAELQELYAQIFTVDRNPAPNGLVVDPEGEVSEAAAGVIPVANLVSASLDDLSMLNPRNGYNSILNAVDLEVYSASSANAKDKERDLKRQLRSRFTFYQRRLEVILSQGDSWSYDECMLDFWDEFFPLTSSIHYYDCHTAVPRISRLQQFLMQPCPKEIGIIQCEIERVKISSKKRKGVSMKGRLFPTYEYRLFIKDRQHGESNGEGEPPFEDDSGARRDTVLMIAKNRGRKHVDTSGVVSLTPVSKKGANNYYLYTPQQADVDTHFNAINETEQEVTGNNNGCSLSFAPSGPAPAVLVGRLQSNFIGTEFQIYTPRLRKNLPGKRILRCASLNESPCSNDEGYDSGAASDTGGRRRSRFGRLTLRRSSAASPSATDQALSPSSSRSRSRSTSRSPQEMPSSVRAPRMNRRAIANSVEEAPEPDNDLMNQQPFLCEEEDGVITYTANLLGSRPRIMDVCIPKISPDGHVGADWRNFLENYDGPDDCAPYNRMLNCFKQLQQRLESQNANENTQRPNEADDANQTDDFGLLALQNRPPWWNIELGSFVLNFRGRVSVASVKNFQLCDRNDHDHIMLQFGRIQGRHSFTMDYQYPLTAVQAFSIAISSLQSKISFG